MQSELKNSALTQQVTMLVEAKQKIEAEKQNIEAEKQKIEAEKQKIERTAKQHEGDVIKLLALADELTAAKDYEEKLKLEAITKIKVTDDKRVRIRPLL